MNGIETLTESAVQYTTMCRAPTINTKHSRSETSHSNLLGSVIFLANTPSQVAPHKFPHRIMPVEATSVDGSHRLKLAEPRRPSSNISAQIR
ncbi:uncharacterized protein PHALS_06474 [Plasmopara halstedii]|uniref:Uncharacterized protein n=1 Tax=Plasmopara halstedii TaxID=4781 RepID=A0A0P1B2Y6_PLAHL|nr:uncharacterized protein PHALS_06474 [Plasmopara halstedii]CEG48663.1 hypothetical protein PHALS_06474 [Plasmopara halstedii]|eukprot:XP_024585032.1 hypothetical protein PHALS_06474 [Plasmopara halstedii]